MDQKYFNRDLSWLTFNLRVLEEARDPSVPIMDRVKFLAIYSSNLDEFFRVRVAGIRSLEKINKEKINKKLNFDPSTLLQEIRTEVDRQLTIYGKTLSEVFTELDQKGLSIYKEGNDLSSEQKSALLYYFKTKVLAYLKPRIWQISKGEDFLNNRELYLSVKMTKAGETHFAYVNIPSDKLPRFFQLPTEKGKYQFIFLDDILRLHLDIIFPGYKIEECISIKLNKDADLHIDDEYSGDLVSKIEKQITKRDLGEPSRFLYDSITSEALKLHLQKQFNLEPLDMVAGGRYHNLNDYFQLPNPLGSEAEYKKLPPIRHKILDQHRSMFSAIEEKDQLLHFPYHSYDYVLQFFNEAAIDPDVTEINVTFYRMAEKSVIGDALISASKNGKKVKVFMELKARFDEANNLMWASKMQEAGVKIIYSIPGLKVHAKVALVKKKHEDGNTRYYGFFGTGNLNEETAKIYADHGLFTCHDGMTDELAQVFKFLYKRKQPTGFSYLLVSQFNIVDRFYQLIDREIENARQGKQAHIIIKLNNLEETGIIDKLYEASNAGVKIEMIIRSICCLRPGLKDISEHITMRRIVDRFLEHARVFIFHNGGDEEIYMGSADWMTRNLYRRVEVIFPILDEILKNEIQEIIQLQLKDNVKATLLDENINDQPVKKGKKKILAQFGTYEFVRNMES